MTFLRSSAWAEAIQAAHSTIRNPPATERSEKLRGEACADSSWSHHYTARRFRRGILLRDHGTLRHPGGGQHAQYLGTADSHEVAGRVGGWARSQADESLSADASQCHGWLDDL